MRRRPRHFIKRSRSIRVSRNALKQPRHRALVAETVGGSRDRRPPAAVLFPTIPTGEQSRDRAHLVGPDRRGETVLRPPSRSTRHDAAAHSIGQPSPRGRRPAEAIAEFHAAWTLRPELHQARANEGIANCSPADFRTGWANYEFRFQKASPPSASFHRPTLARLRTARWKKTILIHGRAGSGAIPIQFAATSRSSRRKAPRSA